MQRPVELPFHITLLLAGILLVSARNADYNRQILNCTRYNRWHQPKVECVCSCSKKPEQKLIMELKKQESELV